MGSFYGTVFQEFKKLFNRFKIKNNVNSNLLDEKIDISQPDLVANSKSDALNISAGNHWIKMVSNPDNQELTIYHDKSATITSYNVPIFNTNIKDTTGFKQLEPGGYFEITTSLNYDMAGHETLKVGQAQRPTQVYRLPMTDTEVELTDIKDRLTDLESDKVTQDELKAIDNRVDNLEKATPTYATKEMTGSVDDMRSSYYYNQFTSIAQLIGNVEELNKAMDYNPEDSVKNVRSLCDALKGVIPGLMETITKLEALATSQQVDIYELKERVKNLENS